MGLSDGAILAQPSPYVPRSLQGLPAGLPSELAADFRQLPLRNSMPPGTEGDRNAELLQVETIAVLLWESQPEFPISCFLLVACSICEFALLKTFLCCLAGFEAAVEEFEQWVPVLLLDAMQRAGYFKAVGDSSTAAALKEKVDQNYARFFDEALSALCAAGMYLPPALPPWAFPPGQFCPPILIQNLATPVTSCT